MRRDSRFLTSESVGEGHPDKIADQISDAILDACLREDPGSRVACETLTTAGMVFVAGEVTTHAYVDIQGVVRETVREIGYDKPEYGLDYESMAVINSIHNQSPDIALGLSLGKGLFQGQGAGDQGIMFGYACKETTELMPAPIIYAHRIMRHAAKMRKARTIPWLRPDAKSQITIEYQGHRPKRADVIVVSHQHDPEIPYDQIKKTIIEQIIYPVLAPTGLLDERTKFYVNPTGRFVIGGPQGDTGLSGRKLIVDTYGGVGRHGGGSFSGKDPSKVDRSGAYMARYIAKNLVASGICERCEVGLAYAIGVSDPVAVSVEGFGSAQIPEERLEWILPRVFDLTPAGIIETFGLKAPIYQQTAVYGHFGRDQFPWEKMDCMEALKQHF